MLNLVEWVWTNDLTLLAIEKLLKVQMSHPMAKRLFIWSHIPEKTLPLSYPGRANISFVSLQNPTNYLHENLVG